jgi:hypothetical protein
VLWAASNTVRRPASASAGEQDSADVLRRVRMNVLRKDCVS